MSLIIVARTLLLAAGAYLGVGLGLAAWIAARGAARLDPAAAGSGWGFRILIVPGATLLWPILAARLLKGAAGPPEERNAHRLAARKAGS